MTAAEHAPGRIWGSRLGRLILCQCGQELGPSWETVADVIADHKAEVAREEKAA